MAKRTEISTKETPELELKARESVIRVGGHARLNPSNLKAAGLKSAGPMRVKAKGREVILTVVSDGTVGTGEVVIRAPDLRRLKVATGAKVTVSGHELISATARRQAREAGAATMKAARDTGKAAIRARQRVKKARIKATKRLTSGRRAKAKAGAKSKAGSRASKSKNKKGARK